ncbi:MAG: DUF3604 domain-containing protein [Acidobacteriota bacterium]|nr:MAG: DUF3604 domain-containing protein [Acidobacteriota bacterium]
MLMKPVCDEIVQTADKYSEPGKFTVLAGYEWTSLVKETTCTLV